MAEVPLPAGALRQMERRRDAEWRADSAALKLHWRARLVRNWLHVLPGESMLVFGAGSGLWTDPLSAVLRGRNPITALTFDDELAAQAKGKSKPGVTVVSAADFDWGAAGSFRYIVGVGVLGRGYYEQALKAMYRLLEPGGQLLLFEVNCGNPWLALRDTGTRLLPPRAKLFPALRAAGFTDYHLQPYDMVPVHMRPETIRRIQSKLLVLEHIPGLRAFCGTLSIWGGKPGEPVAGAVHMAEHHRLYGKVSVVVPCHNEEMNVRGLVKALLGMYGPYIHEIVLVNDNSRDHTAQVARALGREDPRVKLVDRTPPNGVGRALRDGFAAATGEYVLSMDCDFIHLLPEFRDLFDEIAAGHDGAIGSRFSHSSVLIGYPLAKILCNRFLHLLLKPLVATTIRDISNNLKLYRAGIVKNMVIREPHFAANLETGLAPLRAGYNIREVPISWVNRTEKMGASSFGLLKAGPGYVRVLLRALWARLFGAGH